MLVVVGVVVLLGASNGRSRAEDLVPLPGNQPAAATELAAENEAPDSRALRMELYLAPRDRTGLNRLLEQQQDPASPEYHRWLSAAEYGRRFGPTERDVRDVTRWLTDGGFTVTFASAGEGRITFEGDVGRARTAFRVQIAGSVDGRYFGNTSDPMVPASLAPKISYVAGLDNLNATTMHTIITDPHNNNGITSHHFGPPDVWTYYDVKGLLDAGCDGRGQCIAVLEGSDVDQASLGDFNTVFGLPSFVAGVNYDAVYPDGPPGIEPPIDRGTAQAYSEALVDIEYAHGLAPGAEVVVYAGNVAGLGPQGLVDTLKAATADNRCGAIAISWAQCGEPKSFYRMLDDSYARGASQGQSIFVATGDVGVGGPTLFNRRTGGCRTPTRPTIEENAGSPNVTAVGATEIREGQYDASGNDVGVGVPAEEVWFIDIQHLIRGASTGGVSTVFRKPTYQKGIRSAKFRKRAVPDICLGGGTFAFPGFWECLDFGLYSHGVPSGPVCTVGGGTSVVPPQWAGIVSCVQQRQGKRLGNINPQLYALAKANLGNLAAVGIRDVTQGNNGWFPLTGYNAGPGFDLASGWGSVDVATFVNAFSSFVPPKRKK